MTAIATTNAMLFVSIANWFYSKPKGANQGIVMLAFGLMMLYFGRRSGRAQGVHLAEESAEGRATQKRELRIGLKKKH